MSFFQQTQTDFAFSHITVSLVEQIPPWLFHSGENVPRRWWPLLALWLTAEPGPLFQIHWWFPGEAAASLRVKLYFIWGDFQAPQCHIILEIEAKSLTRPFMVLQNNYAMTTYWIPSFLLLLSQNVAAVKLDSVQSRTSDIVMLQRFYHGGLPKMARGNVCKGKD